MESIIDDYADDYSTTTILTNDSKLTGEIEESGDKDWFKITLDAGTTYMFELLSAAGGGGTLDSSYPINCAHLTLYDTNGYYIDSATDGGTGEDPLIFFEASESGSYYLEASAYFSGTGTYTIKATSVNNTNYPNLIQGTDEDDYLTGTSSNDIIMGDSGTDTLILPGLPSQYYTPDHYLSNSGKLVGAEGTDTLSSIEQFRFGSSLGSDIFTIDLSASDLCSYDDGTNRAEVLLKDICSLYVAFFNRAPDYEGLMYWFKENITGNLSITDTALCFTYVDEYKDTYQNQENNHDFITSVYQNLYNYQPNSTDFEYWDRMIPSTYPNYAFAWSTINNGPYSSDSDSLDASIITNKCDVALYYAEQVATSQDQSNYEDIGAILSRVTSDTETVQQAEAAIDYVLDNDITLVGIINDTQLWESFWVSPTEDNSNTDIIQGTNNNDYLTGTSSNDTIDGGKGTDTLILSGLPSQYVIPDTYDSTNGTIELVGAEGTDTLSSIEQFRFGSSLGSDIFTIDLSASDLCSYDDGTNRAEVLLKDICSLYVAFFNRAPDYEGLMYWFKENITGNLSITDTALCFTYVDEYKDTYQNQENNHDFITSVYQNLYNYQPNSTDFEYWDRMIPSTYPNYAFAWSTINNGPYSSDSDSLDASIITNKCDVALYYAEQVATSQDQSNYEDIGAILSRVTSDTETVQQAEAAIDYVLDNDITLVGIINDTQLWESFWVSPTEDNSNTDIIQGTNNNDYLTGTSSNDTIDGGKGTDTLILSGLPSQYVIPDTYDSTNGTIELVGAEGTDTLSSIEQFRFGSSLGSDIFTIDLSASDLCSYDDGTNRAEVLLKDICSLYVAFFNRAPDYEGLMYWFKENITGNLSITDTALCFTYVDEYKDTYQNQENNHDFITSVYQNLYNYQPNSTDFEYWDRMIPSTYPNYAFAWSTINNGPYSSDSDSLDASIITNKCDVALYYAEQVATSQDQSNYEDIGAILSRVTSDTETVQQAEAAIDYVLDNDITLVGIINDTQLWESFWE
jgi:Ca2+-binding RTX toxin-like protein